MENTSDSFMPGSLLFCMKSKKSVCYSVADNNQGFSVNVAYNGIRMALAHTTGEQEYFSIEDMMEITGESREEVVKQVEDMRAAALAAGKNPDDYAVPVERKILYFPDGFTS